MQPKVVHKYAETPHMNSSPQNARPLPDRDGSKAGTPSASSADQLEYLADMIQEMRDIALRADLTTLGGILDLAYTEARLQSSRMR